MVNPKFVTGNVFGKCNGGSTAIPLKQQGFKEGSTVYVALTGWHFKFTQNPRPMHEIGIYTRRPGLGHMEWSPEFKAQDKGDPYPGQVDGEFIVIYNDDNDDDPFECRINYTMMGEAKVPVSA